MESLDTLFQPLKVGDTQIKNRIIMAPMTRNRANLNGVPNDTMVEYYRQRASAGLIITEGVYPEPMGNGYLFTPGLCNEEQVAGWKKVTAAVHDAGGKIFCQIMHVGRLSDPLLLEGDDPCGPSAVRPDPEARHYTITCPRAKRAYPMPRALETREVYEVIGHYKRCAELAKEAGFDGVEIHGGSGYLPMQFLSTNTNQRTDEFGGSIEKRARFVLSCVDEMIEAVGAGFVAVKFSPGWGFHNVFDDDAIGTYSYVVKELSKRHIAFLEIGNYGMEWDVYGTLRPLFDGPFMAVAGFTRKTGAEMIAAGGADMIGYGQAFISNPDLAERFQNGWGINAPQIPSYYSQGSEGYTDYPFYDGNSDNSSLLHVDEPLIPISPETTG